MYSYVRSILILFEVFENPTVCSVSFQISGVFPKVCVQTSLSLAAPCGHGHLAPRAWPGARPHHGPRSLWSRASHHMVWLS